MQVKRPGPKQFHRDGLRVPPAGSAWMARVKYTGGLGDSGARRRRVLGAGRKPIRLPNWRGKEFRAEISVKP